PAGCDLVALVRVADPPAGRCRPIPRFWPRTDDGILDELSASAQGLRDRLSHLRCAGLPAHVARARPFPDHRLDRAHDGVAGLLVAEVLEHHRAGPDLPRGVGDPLAGRGRRTPVPGPATR